MLYALLSPARAQLKFGYSATEVGVRMRARALYSVLLASFEGDRTDERSIHRAMNDDARGGEWFAISPATLTFLGRLFEDSVAAIAWARANPACRIPHHVFEATKTRRRTAARIASR